MDSNWRVRGACRGRDPAPFFAVDGEPRSAIRLRESGAKRLCARCPVRPQCAAVALAAGERHGVWGGFTARERARLVECGWEDLVDERDRADIAGLERRLSRPCAPKAPAIRATRARHV